jgi:hypothetical protein
MRLLARFCSAGTRGTGLMRFLPTLVALCPFLAGMTADTPATQSADQFMRLVKEHRFEEAANAFFYPPNFTPLRLTREHAEIAGFLQSLFTVAGDVNSETKSLPPGESTWWALGVSAADKPLSPSDIGADSSDVVRYLVRCAKEGESLIALNFAHTQGKWLILRFDFRIPRSADNGSEHFEEFTRKVYSGCRACQPTKERET